MASQDHAPSITAVTSGQSHTPDLNTPWRYAPWHVAEGEPEVRARDGWIVCTTCGDDYARLIAAAPELLDALKALDESILGRAESNASGNPEWEYVSRRINAARAAIAKAEGRP